MNLAALLILLAFVVGGGSLIFFFDRLFRLDGGKLGDDGSLLSDVDPTGSCAGDGGGDGD